MSINSYDIQTNNLNKDIYYKKRIKKRMKNNLFCGNCGKNGHIYKYCLEPINSYGIILFKLNLDDTLKEYITNKLENYNIYNHEGINIINENNLNLFCELKDKIEFLMIRRKHTLGYIEFVRGRYNVENIDGIIFLFRQMIKEEIERIANYNFDELWNDLWSHNKTKSVFQNEYITAKNKFEKIVKGSELYLPLTFYIKNVIPTWKFQEWGFPKGRRNSYEDDLTCAIREFKEETGLNSTDFKIINKNQLIEEFIGTNGICYKHIYYTGISLTNTNLKIDPENCSQCDEIGDIGFFTFEKAIELIRPYHTDRKNILSNIYINILNNIIDIINKKQT